MDFEALNKDVKDWARLQVRRLQSEVGRLTLKDRRSLMKRKAQTARLLTESIGYAAMMNAGQIERINFRFERHGIFFERGRFGVPGKKGSRTRTPKPWIAPILDRSIDDLAAILENKYADVVSGEIKFVVPGVIAKRVKVNNG